MNFTIYYDSEITDGNEAYYLKLENINIGANTEALIAMINEDRFIDTKQYLVNVLPLVKAVELRGGGINQCDNCGADEMSSGDRIRLEMDEPAWSNCAGCTMK